MHYPSATASATKPLATRQTTPPAQRARVLVVDDDPAICSMLTTALEIAGHEVISVLRARDALTVLESSPVDLVITDLVMPDIEGIEIIMRVSRLYPGVPIIAISGEGAEGPEEYLSIARLLGANRTLSKPFDCQEFLRVVAELLEPQD